VFLSHHGRLTDENKVNIRNRLGRMKPIVVGEVHQKVGGVRAGKREKSNSRLLAEFYSGDELMNRITNKQWQKRSQPDRINS